MLLNYNLDKILDSLLDLIESISYGSSPLLDNYYSYSKANLDIPIY
jgi:hypothetical protein